MSIGRWAPNESSTSRDQTSLEADPADQVIDVDAPVAQCAAVLVGFGDRRVEGNDALQAGHKNRRSS